VHLKGLQFGFLECHKGRMSRDEFSQHIIAARGLS